MILDIVLNATFQVVRNVITRVKNVFHVLIAQQFSAMESVNVKLILSLMQKDSVIAVIMDVINVRKKIQRNV